VRSGFKDLTNRVTGSPLPGAFRALCGLSLAGWQALPPGLDFDLETSIPGLQGPASFWAEALVTAGSQALAHYMSGPYAGQAALTENRVGQGSACYLGWYPTVDQAGAILANRLERAGVPLRDDLPEGLVAVRRGPYTLLFNFAEGDQTACVDGKSIHVGGRDFILLREE
jgi:beta-galactosidase